MIIPYQSLAADTLNNLIEEFVTREGTDYGQLELTIAEKVDAVKQLLHSGEVVVLYIESTQSVNIVTKETLNKTSEVEY